MYLIRTRLGSKGTQKRTEVLIFSRSASELAPFKEFQDFLVSLQWRPLCRVPRYLMSGRPATDLNATADQINDLK